MRYLDDEWMERADAALAEAWAAVPAEERDGTGGGDGAPEGTSGGAPERTGGRSPGSVVVDMEVTGAPDGACRYHLFCGDDGAGVREGRAEDGELGRPADASMSLEWDTAVGIARSELSPQVAFMQGALKLGGDVTVLIRGAPALAALGDAMASLRADTEF